MGKIQGVRPPQAAVEVQDLLFFLNPPKQNQHTHLRQLAGRPQLELGQGAQSSQVGAGRPPGCQWVSFLCSFLPCQQATGI